MAKKKEETSEEAVEDNLPETKEATTAPEMPAPAKEQMVPLSMVSTMIEEAMQKMADKDKPLKVKKVTEHHVHIFRLNGKWIIDFKDNNYDYENKKKIDPYIKEKIHAYQVWNQNKRENEAWIELMFHDGTSEKIPLNRYVERRTQVYLPIIKRHQRDLSYSVGEVEKKKEVGDKLVGTGLVVDMEVTMHEETFEVETPEGLHFMIPWYAAC